MASAQYKRLSDDMNSGEIEWNLQTACYVLGRIDILWAEGFITKEEWNDLHDRVPIAVEDMEKINF